MVISIKFLQLSKYGLNILPLTPIRFLSSSILAVNKFTKRSHNCGQLDKNDVGKKVQLYGWVQYTRFNNKIIALRDSYGTVQCVLSQDNLIESFKRINISNESVLKITGTVKSRPKGQENARLGTGQIEIAADSIEILSKAKSDLPILTRNEQSEPSWEVRLKNRHLDLRSHEMQHALRFRSLVCQVLRTKLLSLKFVECETPTLYNRTPGGANEFIVPTREKNQFYSLVQSPQQLKQLLMIGGLDRYFQICRCYRDEQIRTDRQPEFTQLDIELSFTSRDLIIKMIDELMFDLLSKISHSAELQSDLTSSFVDGNIKKITYKEAFTKYGTDKPDIRFEWLINDAEDGYLYIEVPHNLVEQGLKEVIENEKLALDTNRVIEYDLNNTGTTIIKMADNSDESRKLLGRVRLALANKMHNLGKKVFKNRFSFLWVVDFPLFTLNVEGKLEPNHHPFTAPTKNTQHLLKVNPMEVLAQHYDLVLNGQEVAGGSIRIHDAELQRQIFTDLLNLDESNFQYFIEALKSGCPPHGGIAFGLDRLVAILINKGSIRDVIAFPKSSSGRDLLSECPHELAADVRSLYHI